MLLQPLQCALGLSPLPIVIEKGLEAAAAGTFSQRGLRWGPPRNSARGLAGPVCPASAPDRCLPVSCLRSGSLSASAPSPGFSLMPF